MGRLVVAVVIVGVLASQVARADPAADALIASLDQDLKDHHAGAAYVRAIAAAERAPDEVRFRYRSGLAALHLLRLDDATHEVELGLARAPEDPYLHALDATILFRGGKDEAARGEAKHALARDPKQELALWVIDQLNLFSRAKTRLSMVGNMPGAPTAEGMADRLIDRVVAGANANEIAGYFDLDVLPGGSDEARRAAIVDFLHGAMEELAANPIVRGMHLLGWEIPAGQGSGDTPTIDVQLATEMTFTVENVASLRAALANPATAAMTLHGTPALAEVEPADRAALLEHLVGVTTQQVTDVRLVLVHKGDGYRLHGIEIAGIDVTAGLARLPPEEVTSADRDRGIAYRAGYLFAMLATIAGIIVAVVWAVRRR